MQTKGAKLQKSWLIALLVGVLGITIGQSLLFNQGKMIGYVLPFAPPLLMLLTYYSFFNLKSLYYLIILTIPFSIEFVLPGNYGMSLPSEPLMFGMMLLFLVQLLLSDIDKSYLKHPITLFLGLFILWMIVTSFESTHSWVSIKFIIMKCWFILVFYVFTIYILRATHDVNKVLSLYIIGMILVVTYSLLNHARFRFDFANSNTVMRPFFRNHVNYGATIAAIFPYLAIGAFYRGFSLKKRRILKVMLFIATLGLLFTYTRASYGAIFLLPFVYITYRLKIMSAVLVVAIVVIGLFINFFFSNFFYMNYALEGGYTEYHSESYAKQLQATTKLKDVSMMERFYRWIAAYNMIKEKPAFGFGAGTFIFEYRNHTVEAFKTSVSDNPENSGLHSQYLTYWVEMGWAGMGIHVLFTVYLLIFAGRVYHQTYNRLLKKQVLAAILSLMTIVIHNVVNDLLEVDKIASLYFIAIAIIVYADLKNRERLNVQQTTSS